MTSIRAWTDSEGGAPLRCCLRDSQVGERLLLGAVAPPGPLGAYAETGPVFMHADHCPGSASSGYPEDFRARQQVFRAYDNAGQIVGGEIVDRGRNQEEVAERLLFHAWDGFPPQPKPRLRLLHVRHWQCRSPARLTIVNRSPRPNRGQAVSG